MVIPVSRSPSLKGVAQAVGLYTVKRLAINGVRLTSYGVTYACRCHQVAFVSGVYEHFTFKRLSGLHLNNGNLFVFHLHTGFPVQP